MRYRIQFADGTQVEVDAESSGAARAIAHDEALKRNRHVRCLSSWEEQAPVRIVLCREIKP